MRVEGREWPTDYRGPLWIHAANSAPTEEAIRDCENFYESLYTGVAERPQFPLRYPTGVLLGRVELVDCLTQQDYRISTPPKIAEIHDSKFHHIVINPMKLIVPIRMHGGKQIYNMEREIWEGAKKGLRRICTSWWPPDEEVEDSDLFS